MAVESFEDDLVLPLVADAPTSPMHQPKLKRLKKSSRSSPPPPIRVSSGSSKTLEKEELEKRPSIEEEKEEILEEKSDSADMEEEVREKKSAKKKLFMGEVEEGIPKKKRTQTDRKYKEKSTIMPQIGGSGDEDLPDDGIDPLFTVPAFDEGTIDLEKEEEEIVKRKSRKKSRSKTDGLERKAKESAREMKRIEKERQARLEQIHAESQRLLRETRNASFKPVPSVQKPISSVLEKIRLRKLEIMRRNGLVCQSDSVTEVEYSMDEVAQSSEPISNPTETSNKRAEDDENKKVEDPISSEGVQDDSIALDPCATVPCNNEDPVDADIVEGDVVLLDQQETIPCNNEDPVASDVLEGDAILQQATIPSNVDVGTRSESTDGNNKPNDLEDSPDQSLRSSNLHHDSSDDLSSDEIEDKENIDPHVSRVVNVDSSPSNHLAKAFLDDEAEEEDDSDHDLTRFRESDEDDESNDDDDNDVDDLIATGYKEAPTDFEKRNELHQKWLEQQDEAGTDNLLQRLNCGKKQRVIASLDNEDDDGDNDDDEEFSEADDNKVSNDIPVTSMVRQNAKHAKQMIAQMFSDGDDKYVPSDDDESEQTLIRQRVLKDNSSESSFISPIEDEQSREVFGRIKKLNTAPTLKKRGRIATSSLDMLVGNSSSSKTSFLNRTSSNSLPSYKQGSSTVRAFIFGRDDSNSRSSIQASGKNAEKVSKESQPSRSGTSTKITSTSQSKSTVSVMAESNASSSSLSLFHILRNSSRQFDRGQKNSQEVTESQATYQFSSFRLRNRR